jgi:hypothetical protein
MKRSDFQTEEVVFVLWTVAQEYDWIDRMFRYTSRTDHINIAAFFFKSRDKTGQLVMNTKKAWKF